MSKIPPGRLLAYLIVLGLIPLFFAGMHFFYQKKKLNAQEAMIDALCQKFVLEREKQELNEIIYCHYQNADRLYIEEKLETLSFLNQEREKVNQLLELEIFKDNALFQKRLNFLLGKQNRLIFVEGKVEAFPYFKEILLNLSHPVEIESQDLKTILEKIEPPFESLSSSQCPHFIITDFKLERKKQDEQSELFKLDLKLLKRDYLKNIS